LFSRCGRNQRTAKETTGRKVPSVNQVQKLRPVLRAKNPVAHGMNRKHYEYRHSGAKIKPFCKLRIAFEMVYRRYAKVYFMRLKMRRNDFDFISRFL
jgi:hypothetical protein